MQSKRTLFHASKYSRAILMVFMAVSLGGLALSYPPRLLADKPAAELFTTYCVQCHGADGRGMAEARKTMPSLPDFTNGNWQKAQSSPLLVISVLEGKNRLMPAWWGKVSDQEAKDLVAYVRTFDPTVAKAVPAPTPPVEGSKPAEGTKPIEKPPAADVASTGDFDKDMAALRARLNELDGQRAAVLASPPKPSPAESKPAAKPAPTPSVEAKPAPGTTPAVEVKPSESGAKPAPKGAPAETEASQPDTVLVGASRFFGTHCAGCHTIGGTVQMTGPDLKDVTQHERWKGKREELIKFLMNPRAVLENHPEDPTFQDLRLRAKIFVMPNIDGLTRQRAETMLDFLEEQSKGKSWFSEVPIPGNPFFSEAEIANGRDYFVGRKAFAKGGPACIACHTVDDSGGLEGGRLGPDLTKVYGRIGGKVALYARLQRPVLTMSPVFHAHALEQEELRSLVGYLEEKNNDKDATERPTVPPLKLILMGLGGAVLGLGALTVIGGSRFWRSPRMKNEE